MFFCFFFFQVTLYLRLESLPTVSGFEPNTNFYFVFFIASFLSLYSDSNGLYYVVYSSLVDSKWICFVFLSSSLRIYNASVTVDFVITI